MRYYNRKEDNAMTKNKTKVEKTALEVTVPVTTPIPTSFTVTDMKRVTKKDKDGKETKVFVTHTWKTPKFVKDAKAIDAIKSAYAFIQNWTVDNSMREKRYNLEKELEKGDKKDLEKIDSLRSDIAELEYIIANYPVSVPDESVATADLVSLVCAWAHNPVWGKDKKDGDTIICRKWHFKFMEELAIYCNQYRKEWNAQPDSEEKRHAKSVLKGQLAEFCNRYLPNGDSEIYKSRQLSGTEYKDKWLADYVIPACYSGIKSHSLTNKALGDKDYQRIIQTILQVMYHGKCGLDAEILTQVKTSSAFEV